MNSCGDPEQDGKKIADLLKYGAHSLVGHNSASALRAQIAATSSKSSVELRWICPFGPNVFGMKLL